MNVRDRRAKSWREKRQFATVARAAKEYERRLRSVARHVGSITKVLGPREAEAALRRYATQIEPWAKAVAARFLVDVSRRDDRVWARLSTEMGAALREEVKGAPTGAVMRGLMREQVDLITSLPLKAAQRVHELVTHELYGSARAGEIVEEILRTGRVTESSAMRIARTETGRAATALTQARASHVGSEGYVWRTAGDVDVRKIHKKLEGTFHRWDDPPVSGENGERSHPGAIYNCRCFPEVVLPDDFRRTVH